ncbi:hypothetical protein [Cryptosporangium sp. NPDC048952]|uniref:hypothetical protein n=1 Tax=Cryptosporangium sp. NPDC048952 TaxID=3363961 RepID=UPI00371988F5
MAGLGALWTLVAVLTLVAASRADRRRSRLHQPPVQGLGHLTGLKPGTTVAVEVRTGIKTLYAPRTGDECGWFVSLRVQHTQSTDEGGWEIHHEVVLGHDYLPVHDATGTAYLSRRSARRLLTRNFSELGNDDSSVGHYPIDRHGYDEWTAPADTPLFLVGRGRWGDDGGLSDTWSPVNWGRDHRAETRRPCSAPCLTLCGQPTGAQIPCTVLDLSPSGGLTEIRRGMTRADVLDALIADATRYRRRGRRLMPPGLGLIASGVLGILTLTW